VKKLRFLLSLVHDKNDYQLEQAAAAEEAAQRLGVDLKIVYADNDGITQSQQLLQAIQTSGEKPDGILVHPAGTGLAQVATAAVGAGIGWAVLNREVDYLAPLRRNYRIPVFEVTVDQEEVGRIQGRQFGALVPQGGIVLYILGPSTNATSPQRLSGMQATKPANVQVRTLRGRWTEESGYEAVNAWLRLSTSHQTPITLVGSQNDYMALGARKAFEENTEGAEKARWASVPFTGCDAVRATGQEWVRKGLLAASVIVPPTAGLALELFTRALQAGNPPVERTFVSPVSFPVIEKLGAGKQQTSGAHF
jgi:ABC-type sugar transport system substrate-binding protein